MQSYLAWGPLPDTLLRFVALALPGASDAVAERLLAACALRGTCTQHTEP